MRYSEEFPSLLGSFVLLFRFLVFAVSVRFLKLTADVARKLSLSTFFSENAEA